MLKKHSFSPNHKVVDGPHNFHPAGKPTTAPMGAPPEQIGGGPSAAQGGGMDASGGPSANFANGGKAGCYADGGDILGGGVRGKMADYGSAIKQTASDMFGGGDPVKKAQKQAQEDTNAKNDQAIKEAGG